MPRVGGTLGLKHDRTINNKSGQILSDEGHSFVTFRDVASCPALPSARSLLDAAMPDATLVTTHENYSRNGLLPLSRCMRGITMLDSIPCTWRNAMLFFVWFDDSPKKLTSDKLQEAITAYVERFRRRPTLVLINAADQLERTDMAVRTERTVQPNTFWLGHEDQGAPAHA